MQQVAAQPPPIFLVASSGLEPQPQAQAASGRVVLQQSFPRSYWRHPHRRASIRTLNGPHWARCKLGSDFKPGPITWVTGLGCWVLQSNRRSRRIGRSLAVTRTRRWMSLAISLRETDGLSQAIKTDVCFAAMMQNYAAAACAIFVYVPWPRGS
jgi:hypothetical protein